MQSERPHPANASDSFATANRASGYPGIVRDLRELIAAGCRFSTIYADPPWAYENEASRAAASNHYGTMAVDEICAVPVRELAEKNAHLHLWTTNAFLREAFEVIDAWGFRYKSCFVWVKDRLGMGNYWRVSQEFLLLGVRGGLSFRDRTVQSWLKHRRTAHRATGANHRRLLLPSRVRNAKLMATRSRPDEGGAASRGPEM